MRKGMTKYTRKNSRMPLRRALVPAAPRVRPVLREQPERSIQLQQTYRMYIGYCCGYITVSYPVTIRPSRYRR